MNREEITAALMRLAGTERVVIYDVPEDEAPVRPNPTAPFVRGPKSWWRFIDRRRALDNAVDLNLMVSLRGLRRDERLLAVNWGTAFANCFLMVEPSDPWLDLTSDAGIADFQRQSGAQDADALVRAAYADWIYWLADPHGGELESRDATLSLSDPQATLWHSLWERLPQTFPESAFLSSLTVLNLREAELFEGGREVRLAVIPFLTRLGMPIMWDAHKVLNSVRELVNAGLAQVYDPKDNGRVYRGPYNPIPADIPDERFAYMHR